MTKRPKCHICGKADRVAKWDYGRRYWCNRCNRSVKIKDTECEVKEDE